MLTVLCCAVVLPVPADLELIEGLDVSKHGERALSVHVMATGLDGSVNGSVHGSAHGARKGDDTVSVAAV